MYIEDNFSSELIPHPCKGCGDFDEITEKCKSNGGCGQYYTVAKILFLIDKYNIHYMYELISLLKLNYMNLYNFLENEPQYKLSITKFLLKNRIQSK